MKFISEPNMTVYDTEKKVHYHFDEKGELETNDERLINKLKKKFKYEETVTKNKKRK